MIWFHPDNVGLHNIEIRNSPSEWVEFLHASAFWIGQALTLINLKILQLVGLICAYNVSKFGMDSLQI